KPEVPGIVRRVGEGTCVPSLARRACKGKTLFFLSSYQLSAISSIVKRVGGPPRARGGRRWSALPGAPACRCRVAAGGADPAAPPPPRAAPPGGRTATGRRPGAAPPPARPGTGPTPAPAAPRRDPWRSPPPAAAAWAAAPPPRSAGAAPGGGSSSGAARPAAAVPRAPA